jgi:hypothetical protein
LRKLKQTLEQTLLREGQQGDLHPAGEKKWKLKSNSGLEWNIGTSHSSHLAVR